MAVRTTSKELRNMQIDDLQKELRLKRPALAKMRMDVQMGTEKDTAKLRREKRSFAQLLTILHEKELKEKPKTSTVSARKRSPRSSKKS